MRLCPTTGFSAERGADSQLAESAACCPGPFVWDWRRAFQKRIPATACARMLVVVAVALLLSACASRGGYYKNDGPPKRHSVDIHGIPDAVVRDEPLSKSGNKPYVAFGKRYVPLVSAEGYRQRGAASWYGKKFHDKRTSSGERYDMYGMTAAHRTLPLPSFVKVTNLSNGKNVVVRINDRGPFLRNRLIDLSYAAAYKLDIIGTGTGYVEVSLIAGDSTRTAKAAPGGSSNTSVKELSSDAARFYVQFGAFTQSENARSLIRKLRQIGIRFAHIQHSNDGYFRVRSGPFGSAETAGDVVTRGEGFGLSTTIVAE
ncbi:MAG: Endolytic peptidoglycan transglycosylase RlpA [Gammaproteobacteria bacterium]|nr:Endolytic peptidoglycan transglycosylase RlpA [Gammaproteobacteria bacterium]